MEKSKVTNLVVNLSMLNEAKESKLRSMIELNQRAKEDPYAMLEKQRMMKSKSGLDIEDGY